MKTIKINHVVLTLKLHPSGNGMERDEVDNLVNARLAEGYDTVDIFPLRTNFGEGGTVTDAVNLYIFKQNEVEAKAETKAEKAEAKAEAKSKKKAE